LEVSTIAGKVKKSVVENDKKNLKKEPLDLDQHSIELLYPDLQSLYLLDPDPQKIKADPLLCFDKSGSESYLCN